MRANSKWIRMEQPGMRWADHEDVEDLFELHRHVNIFQAQFCLGFGAKTVQSWPGGGREGMPEQPITSTQMVVIQEEWDSFGHASAYFGRLVDFINSSDKFYGSFWTFWLRSTFDVVRQRNMLKTKRFRGFFTHRILNMFQWLQQILRWLRMFQPQFWQVLFRGRGFYRLWWIGQHWSVGLTCLVRAVWAFHITNWRLTFVSLWTHVFPEFWSVDDGIRNFLTPFIIQMQSFFRNWLLMLPEFWNRQSPF